VTDTFIWSPLNSETSDRSHAYRLPMVSGPTDDRGSPQSARPLVHLRSAIVRAGRGPSSRNRRGLSGGIWPEAFDMARGPVAGIETAALTGRGFGPPTATNIKHAAAIAARDQSHPVGADCGVVPRCCKPSALITHQDHPKQEATRERLVRRRYRQSVQGHRCCMTS